MGHLVYFPTERYGGVTQCTEQPQLVQRLCSWLRKAAFIRASASLGCEATLELAPNIVPIRREKAAPGIDGVIEDYCASIGLTESESLRCKRLARNALRTGESKSAAVQFGKRVAGVIRWGCDAPAVGFVPNDGSK